MSEAPTTRGYFNTAHETGDRLEKFRKKAMSQEEWVLAFFRMYPFKTFSVHEVRRRVLPDAPHHSVQRAMSNLTEAGWLVKTDRMVIEKYGRKVHTWGLAATILLV